MQASSPRCWCGIHRQLQLQQRPCICAAFSRCCVPLTPPTSRPRQTNVQCGKKYSPATPATAALAVLIVDNNSNRDVSFEEYS